MNKIKEQMIQYTGTKTIKAVQMTRGEYNKLRGWTVPENENPEDNGYLVEYVGTGNPNVEGFDNYISWSPENTFIEAYRVSETYLDRLFIEISDLNQKILKIDEALISMNLDKQERGFLMIQVQILRAYRNILSMRVDYAYTKEKESKNQKKYKVINKLTKAICGEFPTKGQAGKWVEEYTNEQNEGLSPDQPEYCSPFDFELIEL